MTVKENKKNKPFRLYFLAYLPSFLWAGLIFFFSDQEILPGFSISLLDFLFKKLAHMFVYAVLYGLLYHAYKITHPQSKLTKKHYLIPLAITLLYAITDELHQSSVPGRHATLRDIGYDLLGVSSILLYQQNLL